MRELSANEQKVAAGGQTSDEVIIQDVFNSLGGAVTTTSDGTATTADGTKFYDKDNNGWYEHAERVVNEYTVDVFDPVSGEWKRYEDIEHPDFPSPEEVDEG